MRRFPVNKQKGLEIHVDASQCIERFHSKALAGSLAWVLGQNILQAYYYNSASINPGVQMGSGELMPEVGGGEEVQYNYYCDGLASHPGGSRHSQILHVMETGKSLGLIGHF